MLIVLFFLLITMIDEIFDKFLDSDFGRVVVDKRGKYIFREGFYVGKVK